LGVHRFRLRGQLRQHPGHQQRGERHRTGRQRRLDGLLRDLPRNPLDRQYSRRAPPGPHGLERYSSSNAWYYMERSSLFDAFLNPNDYQNGIVIFNSYRDDRLTLAASVTWIGKGDIQSFGFGAHEGKGAFGVRATALPIYAN